MDPNNSCTAIPSTRHREFFSSISISIFLNMELGWSMEDRRKKKGIFYPRPTGRFRIENCFAEISMWSRGRKLKGKDFFSRYVCKRNFRHLERLLCLSYGLFYPRFGSAVVIGTQGSDRKIISSYHSERQLQLILCYPILTAPISNLLCPNLQFKGGSPLANFPIHNPGMAPCGVASFVHVP